MASVGVTRLNDVSEERRLARRRGAVTRTRTAEPAGPDGVQSMSAPSAATRCSLQWRCKLAPPLNETETSKPASATVSPVVQRMVRGRPV